MSARETLLTPVDIDLLGLLARATTLVEACRRLGISRDRGTYRLRRLTRALGRPVVESGRGGTDHGTTRLTPAGAALLRRGPGRSAVTGRGMVARSATAILEGIYAPGTPPSVAVPGGPRLSVVFEARRGELVRMALDAESVLVARRRMLTSARNVLVGTVEAIHRTGPGTGGAQRLMIVRVAGVPLPVALTDAAVQSLGLVRGRRVYLYVKATALRRLEGDGPRATPGSPRS